MIAAGPTRGRWFARTILVVVVALAGFLPARAADPNYPAPTGYVVDAAGLLSDDTKTRITTIAKELDDKTDAQIAVCLVPSIAPLEIEEYSNGLFRKWGVGNKKSNTGVLLVVAQKERRVRFEVGYGLEGILPDGRVGGILRSEVVPHLKQGDWDGGVLGGVEAVTAIIADDRDVKLASLEGVAAPDTTGDDDSGGDTRFPPVVLLVIGFIIFMVVLNAIAQARRPWRRGPWGGMGGFGGGFGGFGGFGGGSSDGGGFGGFGGGSSGGGGASSGF